MTEYIAFLRGININGKNKVSMAELKAVFEELGFTDVKTYLNSGNVVFSGEQAENNVVVNLLKRAFTDKFRFIIPVFVISKAELTDVLCHAPEWWGSGNKEIYDNLIFILEPTTFSEVLGEIGEPKDGLERIESYKNTIFWSFSRKDYQKTNWWSKTASASVGKQLTIRSAGTVRKICEA